MGSQPASRPVRFTRSLGNKPWDYLRGCRRASIQSANCSRPISPDATRRMILSASSTDDHTSCPLRMRNTSIAAWPVRLLPSMNGWLRMIEKARAAAFSASVGYRSSPPNVIRGCRSADSSAPRFRIPGVPPDCSIMRRCNSRAWLKLI